MREQLERKNIFDLLEDYKATLRAGDFKKWHLVYPAGGELKGTGRVVILATDGFLALFDKDGILFDGHKDNFIGPVDRGYIDEEDWDFERNCRKVSIFRVGNDICVIPQDTWMQEYWKIHTRNGKAKPKPKENVMSARAALLASL